MRRKLVILVFGVCVVGFLFDVAAWAREGNHGVIDVLCEYWWAVLFAILTVVEGTGRLIGRHRRVDSGG